jgi:tRNA acetyltransferase TAN1
VSLEFPREFRPRATVEPLKDFNLLVSSSRGEESDANSELQYLLGELGDKNARTDYTIVSGLTVARTVLEPTRVVNDLRSSLRDCPWKFRYVLKVKPVRAVVACNISEIVAAAARQVSRIRENETFRVSVEKRRNAIPTKEIIDAVASKVPRKVELQNPGKIVMIEIIGDMAGVSVIEPGGVLGVEKEKRLTASQPPTGRNAR